MMMMMMMMMMIIITFFFLGGGAYYRNFTVVLAQEFRKLFFIHLKNNRRNTEESKVSVISKRFVVDFTHVDTELGILYYNDIKFDHTLLKEKPPKLGPFLSNLSFFLKPVILKLVRF